MKRQRTSTAPRVFAAAKVAAGYVAGHLANEES
jgi:hypothetical protein